MILINKTFSEVTPESAENGEHSDSGFVWENAECGFKELVRLLQEHREPSQWPLRAPHTGVWFSSGFSIEDYSTCTERETSIHYSHDNPAKNEKYWCKAVRAAGLVKG